MLRPGLPSPVLFGPDLFVLLILWSGSLAGSSAFPRPMTLNPPTTRALALDSMLAASKDAHPATPQLVLNRAPSSCKHAASNRFS